MSDSVILSNDIIVTIDKYTFNLKKKTDYYVVILDNLNNMDTKIDWIDAINMYSITKKPSSNKLIEKITRKITEKLNKNNTQADIKIIENNSNTNTKTNEMKIFIELERIKQIALKSDINTDDINKKNKKIFNDNTVKDIIINEYIKIYNSNIVNSNTNIVNPNTNIVNYVINIIDNIYKWEITFKHKYGDINAQVLFDSKYYPYAPPQIRFISPKLLDKIDHRISNSKMFKLDYWNPVTQINYLIECVGKVLDKFAKFDTIVSEKKINKELYQKLLILSSYISNDTEEDIMESCNIVNFTSGNSNIINSFDSKPIKKDKTKTGDKFNGTGYRSGADNKWKIEDYEMLQKTKEFELISVLSGISTDLEKLNKDELYDTIENSLLIKFLVDTFNNTSLLDISKRIEMFKLCFNITQNLCIDSIVILLFDTKHHLFNSIKKIYELAKLSAKFDSDNEIITQIMFLWSMIEPLYETYLINSTKSEKSKESKEPVNVSENQTESYNNTMKTMRFDTGNIINSNYKSSYLNALKASKTSTQCMKRLSTEIPTLASELPIHPDASIFLRVDESNPRSMRALITGPPDTPYDSGIFIFDIYLPPNYPTEVPMVNFTNTGNKRFNPNLYNCGKVCLSILGTYIGPTASQTEKWNTSSTLYQVLISIQGQILVEQPYFNEPGYQASYKTPNGDKASEEYNHNIRLFTMQHAMLDLMNNNSYPEFKSVIDNHFKLKKNKIIDVCTKWIEKSKYNSNYTKVGEEIITKLTTY